MCKCLEKVCQPELGKSMRAAEEAVAYSQAGAGAPWRLLTHDMRAAAALSVPNCVLNVPNNRGYFYFYECHEFYFSYIGRIQLQHMRQMRHCKKVQFSTQI